MISMMTMPWRFAVTLSLALFIAILAVALLLTPARNQLAAKINDPTLKLADTIKSAKYERFPHDRAARFHEGEQRPY